MPRKPRIDFPGAFYHIIVRGNNRQPIYLDEQDYRTFLHSLGVAQERYPFSSAHRNQGSPLPHLMRSLLTRYARAFNRRHHRVGHLFSARYKAVLCQKEPYLLELVRYIHLNPVRASMVRSPSAWPWSSHATYLGQASSVLLDTKTVLSQFSKNKTRATAAYEQFVREGLRQGQRSDLYPPETMPLLGDDSFLKQVTSERKELRRDPSISLRLSLQDLASQIAAELKIDSSSLQGVSRDRKISRARTLLTYFAVEYARHPMSRVADFLHLHPSSITKALRRAKQDLDKDKSLFKKLRQAFYQ